MSLDPETQRQLTNLVNRKNYWLGLRVPDHAEAARYDALIDKLLDSRPKIHAIAPDGEIIYDNASPWVKEQVVMNATGQAEVVLTEEQYRDTDLVARLGRTAPSLPPEAKKLPKLTEADVQRAISELHRTDPTEGCG